MKVTTGETRSVMEPLEARVLLAGDVSATVLGGTLLITGDDAANGIMITRAASGDYVVSGVDLGGPTTINGEGVVIIGGVTGGIRLEMRDGNDVVNIGNSAGLPFLIGGKVEADMGEGFNELLIGRALLPGGLSYAARVTIDGDLTVTQGVLGGGNVQLAGVLIRGNASIDLGFGQLDKLFVLESSIGRPGLDLVGVGYDDPPSRIKGDITVTNHTAGLNAYVGPAHVDGDLNIRSSDAVDVIDMVATQVGGGLRLETAGDDDEILIGGRRGAMSFFGVLEIDTGWGADLVHLANADVRLRTTVDLGTTVTWQQLFVAGGLGHFHTGDLRVLGTGRTDVTLGFTATGRPRDRGKTNVHGDLEIALGEGNDFVALRDVRVRGSTGIDTGLGSDRVDLRDSRFTGPVEVLLGEGSNELYVGHTPTHTGTCDFRSSLTVVAGDDFDRVQAKGTSVRGDTSINLGDNAGGIRQWVFLGSQRAPFSTDGLEITADGETHVLLGEGGRRLAANVYGILEITTGNHDDIVDILSAAMRGGARIKTGAGDDEVSLDNAAFFSSFDGDLGDGKDVMVVIRGYFLRQATFDMGAEDDGMYVDRSAFYRGSLFDGGDGDADYINSGLETDNTFTRSAPDVQDFELRFP